MENKIKKIKAIILDVDGVLTDGKMIYSENNEEKIFYVRDGKGINLAQLAGIKVAIMTSEDTGLINRRAKKLKIEDAYLGIKNKYKGVKEFLEKYGLNGEEVAFIGDDVNDLPAFELIGFPIAVNNAVEEVKNMAQEKGGMITKKDGGNGAVREVIEFILKTQNKWGDVLKKDIERQKQEWK